MKRTNWTVALQSLVLVRLGQELGSDTPAARTVHDVLDMIATLAGVFFK